MNKSTLIQTAALLAVAVIMVAATNVKSSPLNSQVTTAATTASPMAIYARDVAHAMRRAETGVLLVEDR
jgi:hypothetical protein